VTDSNPNPYWFKRNIWNVIQVVMLGLIAIIWQNNSMRMDVLSTDIKAMQTLAVSLDKRVALVEQTRFATSDGARLRADIMDRITSSEKIYQDQLTKLKDDLPPAWFREKVNDIIGRMNRAEERLNKQSEDIQKLYFPNKDTP